METNNRNPILVTGAANGIGYASVIRLCSLGYPVIALSRNKEKLNNLKETAGDLCSILPFDLLNEDMTALLDALDLLNVKSLQTVIHNAGVLINKPFEALEISDLRSSYETNVFAPFKVTQAVLPLLKAGAPSHVVHIASMGGVQGSVKFPGLSAYSSSKGALCTLTECLALELSQYKISVNCLALGSVQTEMLSMAFPGYAAPLQPADMASMVAWFCTEGHRFFNGKILPVAVTTP